MMSQLIGAVIQLGIAQRLPFKDNRHLIRPFLRRRFKQLSYRLILWICFFCPVKPDQNPVFFFSRKQLDPLYALTPIFKKFIQYTEIMPDCLFPLSRLEYIAVKIEVQNKVSARAHIVYLKSQAVVFMP